MSLRRGPPWSERWTGKWPDPYFPLASRLERMTPGAGARMTTRSTVTNWVMAAGIGAVAAGLLAWSRPSTRFTLRSPFRGRCWRP